MESRFNLHSLIITIIIMIIIIRIEYSNYGTNVLSP